MKAADLDLASLLEFDPDHAVFRCVGERAVILDAGALGLLRKELIETVGVRVARRVLTRFAYAHGYRLAVTLRARFRWQGRDELGEAGLRVAGMQGHLVMGRSSPEAPPEVVWKFSWEAEEHLRQIGLVDYCACWTLSGFASGFVSATEGREVYSVEHACIAKGDPICRARTRAREAWGPEIEEHLPFFLGERLEDSLDKVIAALKQAEGRLRARARTLAAFAGPSESADGLVARSAAMRQAVELARRVAKVDVTVLLTGRSGAGKERLARLIHASSPRADRPFVAVNCGAIAEALLESELYGHARGAFTGAVQERAGLFEAAGGGTLLLDEIGEISPGMQVKLLRALQEREVRRVGENKARPVDVRVLAATNRNLAEEVRAGRFREDLFFRLRVVEIRLPGLADRREDVLPLAQVLLVEAAARVGRPPPGLSPAAADALMRHPWPGNVRELQNAMERAVALAAGPRVEVDDLPEELRGGVAAPPGARARVRRLDEVEREHIFAALAAHGGNQTLAARALGIGTTTLYRRLKRYGADAAPTGGP
jgi:two-component system, NtrC family, response regulator HydG